ncbi:Down syndrome cell adhesion molecule-like protein 1 [Chamberlinius hualienensis]
MLKISIFIIWSLIAEQYGVEGGQLYFREEPPYKVNFSNTVGAKIGCVAEGETSKPTVSWTLSDGTAIDSIPGLREIHTNGDLVFKTFRPENYRLDIHSTIYRCKATNLAGQLISREVHVNGVIMQSSDIKVYDTYVIEKNTALLRCQIPKVLNGFVRVVGWLRNDNLLIESATDATSTKYAVMPNGDLHIFEVSTSDSGMKYKCKTVNSLTGEVQISSNAGQIFVNVANGLSPPKIIETDENVMAYVGSSAVLPCVVQGNPTPSVKFYKRHVSGELLPVKTNNQINMMKNAIVFKNIQTSDNGIYICKVIDTLNNLQLVFNLTVYKSLTATISPNRFDAKSNDKVTFTCEVDGQPVNSITWFHNGLPIKNNIGNQLTIEKVQESSRGIYQCMAKNEQQMVQAAAELHLSEVSPYFVEQFESVAMMPGSSVTVKCAAKGIPQPSVEWKLYDKVLSNGLRTSIDIKRDTSKVVSILKIDNLNVEDGGLYSCTASNSAGNAEFATRINVYGDIGVRKVPDLLTVSDGQLKLNCPYYGFPVKNIAWKKDDRNLPDNLRQTQFENGTLIVNDADKIMDAGQYKCFVKDIKGKTLDTTLTARILVPPKVIPFTFLDDQFYKGMRSLVTCAISQGDQPLTFEWLKDGKAIPMNMGIVTRKYDQNTDSLSIENVDSRHSGNYTCIVRNQAGKAMHTAQLMVRVRPKIVPFQFGDLHYEGSPARVVCGLQEGDAPIQFSWLHDDQPIANGGSITVFNTDGLSSILSISSLRASSHAGTFTCIARNGAGVDRHKAVLRVNGDHVFEGALARLTCVVYQGDLPLTLNWLIDNQPITTSFGVNVRSVDTYTSILTIDSVQRKHQGNYSCVASNKAASASHTASLVVNVPPKIVPFEFKEEQLVEGLMARVSCIVSRGDLPLDFYWEKSGVVIEPGSLKMQIRSFDEHSSILSIPSVSTQHSGVYTCVVKNDVGMARHSAQLVVKVPPRFVYMPKDTTVVRDSDVIFDCLVDGFPKPQLKWIYSVDALNTHLADEVYNDHNRHIYSNGSLYIKRVTEETEGYYYCHASNGIGKGLSAKVELKINVPPHFKDVNTKLNAVVGTNPEMKCSVEGDTPLKITWYKNDKLIQSKETSHKILTTNTTTDATSTLTIYKVDRNSNGNYTCKAENKYGSNQTVIELAILEPPDAPTQLKVESVESTAVEISWNPSYNGNEFIKKYLIQYKEASANWDDAVMLETVNGVPTNSIVNQLRPSMTYIFRVFAENIRGRSLASQNLRVTTEEDVPSAAPLNVQIEPINTQTFKVTWKAPDEKTWNGKVLGYNIGYKEVDSEKPFLFKTLVTTDPNSNELLVHIGDLKQFTKYAVIVQAYNSKGKGPQTEEIIAMTSEGAPNVSPTDVRCTTLTSQSIHVTWTEVPAASMNGILRGYKVLYKPAMDWLDDFADHFNITLQTSITLNELDKFANYSVQIQALTKAGHGPKSEPVFCKTLDDVPAAPADIKALAVSADSIIVSWKAPDSPNGIIQSYTIYWRQQANLEADTKNHVIPSNVNDYEISGLKNIYQYEFWVTASTIAGEGQVSKTVTQTPSGPNVPAKIVSFDSKITIPWKSNIILPCKAVGTPEPTRTWSLKGNNVEPMEWAKIRADGSLSLQDIKESDAGDYVCKIRNELGENKITHTIIVIVVSSDAMELQWKAPSNKAFRIKGYTLHIRKDGGVWKDVSITGDAKSYRVNSLDCGTRHEVYMSAYNKIGTSASSSIAVFSTNGSGT